MTKKQNKRESLAKLHNTIAKGKSEFADQYRATNRRIEKKKRKIK